MGCLLAAAGIRSIPFGTAQILFRARDRQLFLLNESGSEIWEEFQRSTRVDEVASTLSRRHGIPAERAGTIVEAVLDDWSRSGLFSEPARTIAPSFPAPVAPPPSSRQTYRIFGKPVTVCYSSESQRSRIHPRLSHLATPHEGGAPSIQLVDFDSKSAIFRGQTWEVVESPEEAAGLFFRRLVEAALPESGWIAQLHSAGVSRQGRAVLLAGRKGRGKTTLALSLARQGFNYLGDDLILIDRNRNATPVPFRAALKEGSWHLFQDHLPELVEAEIHRISGLPVKYVDCIRNSDTVPSQVPVAALIFPEYRREAGFLCRSLNSFEALMRVVSEESWLSLESDDISIWSDWIATTPCYEVTYSELPRITRWIGELF